MAGLLIGQVAERAGVATPTVRYYESIGLLKSPARSAAGYRRYSEGTVEELAFIKKAQALGFSLDEIRQVLMLSRTGRTPCEQVLNHGASPSGGRRRTHSAVAAVPRCACGGAGEVERQDNTDLSRALRNHCVG
jgi:DNA-binding transcriptional MerR regulator